MLFAGSSTGWSDEKAANTMRWRLYVGGFQHLPSLAEFSSTSAISGFVGCLSRLYVDDLTLQLARAAADLTGSVQFNLVGYFIPRSHSRCLSLPLCLEWYNGSITSQMTLRPTYPFTALKCKKTRYGRDLIPYCIAKKY